MLTKHDLLGVLFKISDEHLRPFDVAVSPPGCSVINVAHFSQAVLIIECVYLFLSLFRSQLAVWFDKDELPSEITG